MSARNLERTLAELGRCASAGGRRELGAFSVEGTRLVERALRAGAELRAVVAGASFGTGADARERSLLEKLRARPESTPLVAPDALLRELTGGRSYGQLLALVTCPPEPSLEQCLAPDPGAGRPALLCVLDADDPGNVGALVRTALACGARALVALGSSEPYHPKAVRTSMGAIFKLPILRRAQAPPLLAELSAAGCRSLGAVSSGGQELSRAQPGQNPVALFLGSEAHGLPEDITKSLDQALTIPMSSTVDSLSINAAAAVCLYELLRRSRDDAP
jgi:TrmH family RNA methyltransferase